MEQEFTTIIQPKTGLFDLKLGELKQYKDLIFMFVKRTFTTMYKQTVLGPLWLIITPLMTTLISTFVFDDIAGIGTGSDVPYFLFYMVGHTAWSYFSTCLTSTSNTFTANSGIFGKVYFPRLTLPISTVISSLLNFFIQTVMTFVFMLIYYFQGAPIHPNIYLLIVPLLVIEMAMLGLGFGVIISSLTTKYRDLTVLIGFGVQLWMYLTPIIYPASSSPIGKWCLLNPMAPIIETFRYAFLGSGSIPWMFLGISAVETIVILFFGVILFSRVEKTFMDTV